MEEFKTAYYIIYIITVFFALSAAVNIDFKKKQLNTPHKWIIYLVMFAYIFLFGMRSINVGTDTEMYYWQYIHYNEITFGTDAFIGLVFSFLHIFSDDPQIYLFVMSFLFVTLNFYTLKKYAKSHEYNFFLLSFALISFFFFESLGINIIRQGLSLAFFVTGVVLRDLTPKKKLQWILLFILSIFFHFTSLIPVLIYLLVIYFQKIKMVYYYLVYLATVILSIASLSVLFFKDYFIKFLLIDERRSIYLDGNDLSYEVGFKPQFVIFNTAFLLVFIYLNKIQKNDFYSNLLKYYIVTSSIFYMMFQIPFSDRWGIMSWCVIPLLFAPMFKVFSERVSLRATISVFFLIFIFIFFQSR